MRKTFQKRWFIILYLVVMYVMHFSSFLLISPFGMLLNDDLFSLELLNDTPEDKRFVIIPSENNFGIFYGFGQYIYSTRKIKIKEKKYLVYTLSTECKLFFKNEGHIDLSYKGDDYEYYEHGEKLNISEINLTNNESISKEITWFKLKYTFRIIIDFILLVIGMIIFYNVVLERKNLTKKVLKIVFLVSVIGIHLFFLFFATRYFINLILV